MGNNANVLMYIGSVNLSPYINIKHSNSIIIRVLHTSLVKTRYNTINNTLH